MNIACPHCRRRYLPLGEVCANGASLMGARAPLRCPNCNSLSHVQLVGRNTVVALVILVAGVAFSYPSPVSNALLARVPQYEAGAIRADIWAAAVIAAFFVFVFASPLQKVDREVSTPPRNIWGFLGTMVFLSSLFVYGYFLFGN
jgi:hypothetical protein